MGQNRVILSISSDDDSGIAVRLCAGRNLSNCQTRGWRTLFGVLVRHHEPHLHHFLLHYLLKFTAGRFLSFSSLEQVAKPALPA